MIHRYDPRTGKTALFTTKGSKANGLTFDAQGRLLVCDGADGGRRVVARWNLETGERQNLAERFDGKRFNSPNDLCVDRQGRIYFTDPRYVGSEPIELTHQAVYRIEPDGKLAELTHDVEMPNGIVLSPDERTLYVGDHNSGRKPLAAARSAAQAQRDAGLCVSASGEGRTHCRPAADAGRFGKENGCDGMTVDAAGNVYADRRSAGPTGRAGRRSGGQAAGVFPTGPANQVGDPDNFVACPATSSLASGPDSHTLYVTIDTGFYRIGTKANGAHRVWEAAKP